MKVLLLGLNRSGTSAMAYRIYDAIDGRKIMAFEPNTHSGAEDSSFHCSMVEKPKSVVTKCLLYPTNHTQWEDIFSNADLYDHSFWVARDPRDVLISSFFYHWYSGHGASDDRYQLALDRVRAKQHDPQGSSFVDLVAGTLTKDVHELCLWQQSWYDHLTAQFDEIEAHLKIVHYEAITRQDTSVVDEVTGLNTAQAFKLPDDLKRVARSKSSENWRYWFTPQDVEFFKPVFAEYLNRAGYDADDWKLQPVSQIDSGEASEYMARLRTKNPVKRATSLVKQSARHLYNAWRL